MFASEQLRTVYAEGSNLPVQDFKGAPAFTQEPLFTPQAYLSLRVRALKSSLCATAGRARPGIRATAILKPAQYKTSRARPPSPPAASPLALSL